MAATYPGGIKTFSAIVNGVTKLVAALFNSPYEEITAIQTELGTDVAGSAADLKTRLAVSLNDNGTPKNDPIKGWVVLQGSGTAAILDSFNVASITDEGDTGNFTITWDTDFANANYAWVGSGQKSDQQIYVSGSVGVPQVAGSVRVLCANQGGTAQEPDFISIIATGDQ